MDFEKIRWMVKDLGLSGNDLIVYTVIYDYTMSEVGEYCLGYNFLADFIGVSAPTVIRAVRALEKKGYVTRAKKILDNGIYVSLKAVRGI